MITQQSFMFISSYEEMRTDLLNEFSIETMAHTGPRAFPEISGEKVNTTAFVLRREPDTRKREASKGFISVWCMSQMQTQSAQVLKKHYLSSKKN